MDAVGLGWGGSAADHAPAFWCASVGGWQDYGTLRHDTREVAAALRRDSKQLVFALSANDYASVIAYLGALQAGHAVALVDPNTTAERIAYLLEIYRPEFILESGTGSDWPGYAECRSGYAALTAIARTRAELGAICPELCVLLSTSGSTGTPKFVRLSRTNVTHNARAIVRALQLSSEQRPILHLPLHYSYGLSVLNSHLEVGAPMVLTTQGLLEAGFWDRARDLQVTSLACVPYHLDMLRRVDLKRLGLQALSRVTVAGGKTSIATQQHFHALMAARGGRFYVMYGQTEAAPRISTLQPEDLAMKLGSVGQALLDGRIEIVGEDEIGPVVYYGPNVMLGYAQARDDLSRGDECFGRLETGDLGRLDEDGFLFLTGRAKRIAKIFGVRIDLDEVEAIVRSAAAAAAVDGGDRLVVFLAGVESQQCEAARASLVEKTALPKSAVVVRSIPELPLLSSGKIDYATLGGLR